MCGDTYPTYADHPATFCGKPTSMLSVGGILYTWVSSWFNESAANFVHCAPQPRSPGAEAGMVKGSRCLVDPFAMES